MATDGNIFVLFSTVMAASFQARMILMPFCFLGFILLTMVIVIMRILLGTTENIIMLKRADISVLEIIFSNRMKKNPDVYFF